MADSLVGKPLGEAPLIAASALELLQTGILVQDDVMDADEKRRGQDALHKTFAGLAGEMPAGLRRRFGENAAVCIGDIAFFLSSDLLGSMPVDPVTLRRMIKLYSREMALLGAAQIEDLRITGISSAVTEAEILSMYTGKTARYSWILPLLAALELSGKGELLSLEFEEIGRSAGLVFSRTSTLRPKCRRTISPPARTARTIVGRRRLSAAALRTGMFAPRPILS